MIVFEHTTPALLIAVGLLVAAAVMILTFRKFVTREPATLTVLALRLLFLLLLGWCLLLPGMKRSLLRTMKPRFVVALDTSDSMRLPSSDTLSNRWDHAMDALQRPWAAVIEGACDLEVYPFAAAVGEQMSLNQARTLAPDGPATLLREALDTLTARYEGLNVAGALVLSDGIDTREAYNDWAARDRPFPVYTVLLEDTDAWKVEPDVRIETVNTPRRVTLGWNTELKAAVSGHGTEGRPMNVQLFRNDMLYREQPVTLPADGGSRDALFDLQHEAMGSFTYRVHIPALQGESHTNDNTYAVSVQVITARNHLLYVEGPPRWESKYLSRALRANEQVTPLIFLRGPDGSFMSQGRRGSMTPDMREDQLAFFKIVILGNLDAEELGERRAANLVKFVETGGSLVLLGGSKAWGSQGFAQTPLSTLMPGKTGADGPLGGRFTVSLTDAGASHPAFAGDPAFWADPPPLLSILPDVKLSAGAQALVAAEDNRASHPVIAVQRYGQGKVVAVFTDSLWKWQLSPTTLDSKPFRRFWDQLISWLSPRKEDSEQREVDLAADREELHLGQTITLTARTTGEDAPAAEGMTCLLTGPDKRELPFTMSPQSVVTPSGKSFPGFSLTYQADRPGLYAARAVAELGARQAESFPLSFFVKPFTPESQPRPANVEALTALARSSGGRHFRSIEQLDEALAALDIRTREETLSEYTSLWQHGLMIACLMTLLSIGWSIRKSRNMP